MGRLLILLLALSTSSAFCGWQKIAQLDAKATCCFFLDDYVGLAGSGEYNLNDLLKIWRTNDGGYTWVPCTVPLGTGQVTSIYMVDGLVGYASIFSQVSPNFSLWKTTDGGYSWFDHTKGDGGYTTAVWATSRALIKAKWAGAPGGSTSGGRSLNDGTTFRSYFFTPTYENSNGIFFTNDTFGVVTAGPSTGISWYTTNGGVNWMQGGAQAESWSVWGYEGTKTFFAIAELNRELLWTTNGGITWRRRYGFGSILPNTAIPTGHVAGKGKVMYVQTSGAGLLRTAANDDGGTWRWVGGPSNMVDSRAFYVGGCAGELVIAFDMDGNVWRTTDGGDGTLGTGKALSITHLNFPTITACSTLQRFASIAFGDCGEFIITSATIQNDPSGVFQLQPLTLPDTLLPGSSDTFVVSFDPRGNPATFSAQIRVRGEINKLGNITYIDSLIRITASATPVMPRLTSSLNVVAFGELSVCDTETDTTITLKNEGCDTLTIISSSIAATPFTVEQLPLPLDLPPDSSVTFRISFKPMTEGGFNTSTRIKATSQGRQQEIEILLDGKGRFGEGILSISKTSLSFPPLSICSSDSLVASLANTGCDTLVTDSVLVSGDPDFTIVTSLLPGSKLRPNETIWFTVKLQPQQKGIRSGKLQLVLHNEHGAFPPSRGEIGFSTNVVDGTKSITQSLEAIDFGITTLCEERDSVIVFENTGCDTVIISGGSVAGKGFKIMTALPIILPPKEKREIRIATAIDTAGGAVQSVAMFSVMSTAANLLAPIELKRGYIYPRIFGAHVEIDTKEETAGNIIRLAIVGEYGLGNPASEIRSLDATLTLNEDLLHYLDYESPNTVTKNGNRISIANSNELQSTAANVLAELIYEVMLTRDSATDIIMQNITFNQGDTSPCKPQPLGGTGAAFTYRYVCGDRTIQRYLRANEIEITSIRPNPAKDVVTIEIRGSTPNPLEKGALDISEKVASIAVEIYDALGKLVASGNYQLTTTNLLTLATASWSPGIYVVRVGSVSRSFVVER